MKTKFWVFVGLMPVVWAEYLQEIAYKQHGQYPSIYDGYLDYPIYGHWWFALTGIVLFFVYRFIESKFFR
jgi:hypothetical protein